MNLFLDTISPTNALILFDEKRNILKKYFFDVRQNESTLLIEKFDEFLSENNLKYFDLENIVVVNWPGSFTWVRTTILLINTINFLIKKNITSLTYFDLFPSFPIIKSSSKRDSFLKISKDSSPEIISNEDLNIRLLWVNKIYWDIDFLENKEIVKEPNYDEIIKNIEFQKNERIEPYYLKKPSIS